MTSAEIEKQTQEFLKSGGKITVRKRISRLSDLTEQERETILKRSKPNKSPMLVRL